MFEKTGGETGVICLFSQESWLGQRIGVVTLLHSEQLFVLCYKTYR